MTKGLKRILSMVIAVVMVVGMVPTNALHVHAVTDDGKKEVGETAEVVGKYDEPTDTKVDGTHWVAPDAGVLTCTTEIHTHGVGCYEKICSHNNGHPNECYSNSTDYVVCPDVGTNGHTHNGTAALGDVFGWDGSSITWYDHPATSAVKKIYDDTVTAWKAANPKGKYEPSFIYEGRAILAGYNAVKNLTVCFTTTVGAEPDKCTHTCSELGGSCYYKSCTKGEHTHTEPACYTYTWTLAWNVYDVTVTVVGKDGYDAANKPATVTHGQSVSFVLPATGDAYNVWTATIGETAYSLSADSETQVTINNITSADAANIEVVLSNTPVETYSITLNQNSVDGCSAALVQSTNLLANSSTDLQITLPANGTNYKYGYAVEVSEGASYDKATGKVKITNVDATVTVTFVKYTLSGNSTAEVQINPNKTAAEQLDTLKQEIFNKLMVSYVPDGVTYDQITYEYKYWYTYTIRGEQIGETKQSDSYAEISIDPADKDETVGYTTNHPFGYTGLGTVEHVRLSYNGLTIEADVTLAHTHQWGAGVVTAPTCTVGGYTTKTCTTCGASEQYDAVNQLGHSIVNHGAQAPTCTEKGWDAYEACSRCDYSTYVEIPATNHNGTLVEVNAQAPDCDSIGWDAYEYCTACDHTTYVEKPALNHSYGEWYTVQGSTSCTGSTERRDCQNVGCSHYETKDGNGSGHTMGEWNVTTPASCGQAGEERRDCANCDYFETQAITALTHDIKTVEAKSPTCTEIGWDAYEYCDRKDCDHTTYVEKAKLGHGHTAGYRNDNKQNGTHDVFCLDCNTVTNNVPHAFNAEHKCVCGAVETFTITFKNWNGDVIWSGAVEYGTVPTAPAVTAPANHTFIGWDSTVAAVSGPKTYTAKIELNANNGDLPVNTSVEDAAEHLVGLKSKVLKAAGLPENGNYTVTTVVNIELGLGAVDVTLRIDENGVVVNGDWGYLQSVADRLAPAALANDLNGQATKAFSITDNATGVSKTVTHKIVDTRLAATVDELTKKDFGSFDTQSEFETAVKNAITASWTNREGVSGKVAADKIKVNFSNPVVTVVDGKTVKTYSVTVSVSEGTNWLASAESVTFAGLYWTVNQYQITWVDGNGDTLDTDMVDYGAMPSYTGATPTKDATVSTTYTFNNTWSPAVAAVTGNATYIAQFTESARIYVISWDTNGDGTVDTTTEVAYGETPAAPANAEIANKSFAGWSPTIGAVTGAQTYTATYSDDTIYSVTFMVDGTQYGEVQYINVTKNPNAVVAAVADPDKDHAIFAGWDTDIIGETPTKNVVVNATWTAESNNNNELDEDETITVNVEAGGEICFNGKLVSNGDFVFDSTNNNYTIVITPPTGYYVASVEGINLTARAASASYDNGVMTITGVSLTDGAEIKVTFAKHSIPAVANPAMEANGHVDEKVASVTKKAVLEAILGKEVSDAELEQFEVKMYVNLGAVGPMTIDGYYDIWNLSSITQVEVVQGLIKGALNTAIDVPGSESIRVTWKAHDQYPAITETYTVTLSDSRREPGATHTYPDAQKPYYNTSVIDDALLEAIKKNITVDYDGVDYTFAWAAGNPTALEPGQQYTVKVNVTFPGTGEYQKMTKTVDVTISVPYANVTITVPEQADMTYNTGMTDADKTQMVIDALNPVVTPEMPAGTKLTVWYLASEARKVDMVLNLGQMDLGIANSFLPDTATVQVPVGEMWLNIGDDLTIPEMPSNDRIAWILNNDLIPNYGMDFLRGNMTEAQMMEVLASTLQKYPDVAAYYQYLGAHQFGDYKDANGDLKETVYITVEDYGYGAAQSAKCVLTLADTRAETSIVLNEGVAVTYGSYTASELMALLLDGVYADGQKLSGVTVEFVTDVMGLPASEASEIIVKFAGNEQYKPATASANIVINKAQVSVQVDNRLIKWQENLTYAMPVVTTPAGVDTIKFIVGLDVSDVNIDGGVKGILGSVQLMLPEELQALLQSVDDLINSNTSLNISFADGASMKLSELQAAVEAMDDLFAGSEYEEYFRVLLNMLQSLPTETADIEVVIGGKLPTNFGVYLIGAVSADANYETNFGVGVLAIYPDGIKADIAWNQNDENYVITNTLLTNGLFDTQAHATSVGEGGTLEAATAQIAEIFLGVNIDGEITIETDATKLNVGAYVEVAMIVNWGNQMYYSAPIARPIVVVAETLDVDFADETGNVNNDRHFEFFNVPQNGMEGNLLVTYKQDGEGYKAGDAVTDYSVKYYYVGVQTNGKPYASTTAPTHAGAYTITAVITIRDNTGYITHAGQGIGALVIEPSKSTIDVENEAIPYDGNEHTINGFVDANSVNVPGLKPDTTIISAGIHADLDANTGLNAIKGSVNVDMPAWLDSVLNKLNILEAGYADGITADTFLSYVEKVKEAIVELGIEVEAFDKIVSLIEQLPGKTTLTFHDNKGYSEVGAYLVVGIVTDSDHYPSADAGIVVIYPNATKVDLKFNKTWDDNNIFTWNYLQNYDLNAKAYDLGTETENATATAKVTNIFVGFADHGELILTVDKAELDNGVYEQVAIVLDLSNQPYYAEPISREIVIVPNPAEVDFVDEKGNVNNERHFEFNNLPHAMNKIRVTLADGTVLLLDDTNENVDIYYVGVQTNGKPYASYDAPVHAGVYEVTAQYTARDDQNRVVNLGAGVGVLVIEPSKSETTVDNGAYPYGSEHKVNDLVHAESVNVPGLKPDTTVISVGLSTNLDEISGLDSINGTVNVDMPAWLDAVLNKLNVLEAGYADGISTQVFLNYAAQIRETLVELGVDTESFDKIVAVVEQLPISTNLTFHDNIGYTEVGAYLIIAVVTDSDHYPSVGAGIMVIYPNATKVELQFEEDWNGNNIFTWYALQNMNLEAKAYLNGAYHKAADQKVVNLYFGFTDSGEFMLEATTYGESIKDVQEFRNGLYTQLALVNDFGNVMYYAEPVSRSFVVVPTPAIIEFVDENGAVNADRHFIFNNKGHAMPVRITIAGEVVTDQSGLTVTYTGVQTNGKLYSSTDAPVHSGAYTVTATYTTRDEQGRLVTLGAAVGAMVIEPANSTMDVESMLHEYDGNTVSTDKLIHAGSVVNGLTPDKTVITTIISTDGTFSENLLSAITSEVNVDFPKWVDELLAQYAPSIYTEKMTAGEFAEKVMAKLNAAVDKAEALAQEYDIPADKLINALNNALVEVEEIVNQLPTDTVLTFKNQSEVAPKEVGTYLMIGIVTDSDHYPSADVGVLVIYPNVTKAKLDWFYKDSNGIFTLPALAKIDLTARGYVDGAEDSATNAMIAYLTVGIDENGKLVVTTAPNNITSNGAYTEVAYIPTEIGAEMTVAAPIMRSFVVVPQTVTVEVTDTETTFGEAYEVPVTVMKQDGSVVNPENLTLTYVGVNASAGLYHSTVKPTSTGVYSVIATYVEKDGNNEYAYVGMNIGTLTIVPASATVDVENEIHVYDDQKVDVMELIEKMPEDAKLAIFTAMLNLDGDFSEDGILALGTKANIDFPARVDEILRQYLPSAYTDEGIALNPFYQILDEVNAKLVEIGFSVDAMNYLKNQLEQLPANTRLTFKEQSAMNPSTIGVYLIGAVVMDPDYIPAADAGLLVITNDITMAELKWNYRDSNAIITRAALAELDMLASAYVNGAFNADNTARIDYVVLGVGADGRIQLTNDPAEIKNLPNGTYTEIAYIYQQLDATMTLAIPVQRTFTIVEHTVDVIFEDVKVSYDGKAHGVEVVVKDLDKNTIDRPENLTVTYINLGTGYYSTTAPTEVGSYTVIAKYEEFINGDRAFFGMEIGNVTILPGEADYSMSDKTTECGTENAVDSMITNNSNLPYAIYIVKNVAAGEVNVILPAGWEITFQVGDTVDSLITAIEKLPAAIENTKIVETLKSVLNSIDMQTLAVNGEQPSVYGEYDVTAIAFGNKNYDIAKVSAKLTIDHAEDANLDHNCDACGEFAYGTCEDADKDHDCDYGCDKVYGEHKDADKDHACDYGCSEVIGTCGDADKDHDCDYGCDKAYGEHKDADKDHACDYGCSEVIGTCEDADKDHDCDYGCDKVYGEHKDADKDHACDYGCDETIGTCGDADKDHDCDYGCDKVYGEHADGDDTNHTCDYCGDEVAGDICVDNNKDHKCDECGAVMGNNNTPVLGIPALSGENIYGFAVDYANKRLYIDTVKTGLSIEQFVKQLSVAVFNDTDNKADIVVTYQNKTLTGAELIRTEAQVSLTAENPDGKTSIVYDVVVIGDVNCNGEVDSGDAALIQRYFFKEVELTQLQADAADTNRSGEIESGDSVKNQVKYNDTENYQSNLHSYTEYTSNGDATCEEDGTMTIKCTANHNCSAKSVIVPEAGSAKGHKYVYKENAYVCDICGKKLVPNV